MNNKISERIDWQLIFYLLVFGIVSCISIWSAQSSGQYGGNFVSKQIFWYVIGTGIIAVMTIFDTDRYRKLTWYLYGVGNFSLLVLWLSPAKIAPVINGQKSWFRLPGDITIQPSEFMKVLFILALSKVIADHHKKYSEKTIQTDFQLLFKIGLTLALPLFLIMQQPDLGTSLVFLAITAGMIIVSGISWKIVLPIYGLVAAIGVTAIALVLKAPKFLQETFGVAPYQLGRIYSWLDPLNYQTSEGYHLTKSIRAIGSGMLTGKVNTDEGIGNRQVYIPESHTDFIFSVIGEEFGFIGTSFVVSLFFLLIYHLIKISLGTNKDFNVYICSGVVSMIAFHVLQNIGMTIQLVPITGIPLPFISYGGSSLMANMFAMGIIFSIRFHHKNYMFNSTKDLE
ncbi:FtsW/RodA/SpoVE family cell cycle protein [Bacillus solimangrovi]|uniref:Rod shape-determining protein RodA n=1 Tax=Bacillus solimangrovi TaxID=1305675 RepID=A0A1E5LJD6_9BACI|nr:FtsW/RodA/SpoVE family cell cycle protein [Bacillus solimangrovi]OEH94209.1 rod shape-determining protein RodA [Bacillus solimangrovi]